MLKGIAASPGIGIGKAYILEKENFCILEYKIKQEEVEPEIKRFEDAVEETKKQITEIKEKVEEKVGKQEAYIFQTYLNMLQDPLFINETIKTIKEERLNAEASLRRVCRSFPQKLQDVQSEFMQERFRDFEDIAERVLFNLLKKPMLTLSHLEEEIIVVAHNLAPSDTVSMDKKNILGFATDIGGRTSHTTIMARAMEIPAVVGLREITKKVKPGTTIIIDGNRGQVIIDPDRAQIKRYAEKKQKLFAYRKKLEHLKSLPCKTLDGREIELAANIAGPEEIDLTIKNGAEGVGLYRTEYLYMNRTSLPSEEEQLEAYRTIASKVSPHSVIIRTLDIGGDKFLSQLSVPNEINPFMGFRAIRLSLEMVDIFKTQLRAILRASQYGKVKIMFPMISCLEEIRKAKTILALAKKELEEEGMVFASNSLEVGIMIEVPSSAIIPDIFAKEVDFFSLGTNDLIQYTLAVDRVNEKVAYLYQPFHPAILRLIENVVRAAHRENIWVGACGEMASDLLGVSVLLGLGVDELSVASASILEIKKVVRKMDWEELQKITAHLLKLETSQQTKKYLQGKLSKKIRKILKED